MEPEKSIGYFGGGNRMMDLDGNFIYSANITPDKETGIGSWTLEEFEKAVRWGQHRDGQTLRYPMPVYTVLTDEEIEAAIVMDAGRAGRRLSTRFVRVSLHQSQEPPRACVDVLVP